MTTSSVYQFEVGEFSGPLDKLLELIEAEKLDISRLSLARVTDSFLRHLETLEQIPPSLLADFIVVGSQLILLKSKALLPDLSLTTEEESNLAELEERLRLYREFKEAGKLVLALWRKGHHEASRPYFLSISRSLPVGDSQKNFYPGETLTSAGLLASLKRLSQVLEKMVLEEETIRDTVLTLEEKMHDILGRLRRIQEANFSELSPAGSKSEIVVAFLAILHLAREQVITIEQSQHFSDIIIKHNNPE